MRFDSLSIKLADALDKRRSDLRYSQAKLSKLTQIGENQISRYMDGQTARTLAYARLAEALDCDILVTLKPRQATQDGPQRPM